MTDHDTPTTPKNDWQDWLDSWVWYCDETSIAAGKISALAILETFLAVGAWWALAMHFNWSWLSFVALFAAPMLLLRSKESVADGVAMLKRYWERNENNISQTENALIFILITLITGGLTYWLVRHWLPMYSGWDLFWRAVVLGAFAFVFAFVFALVFAVADGVEKLTMATSPDADVFVVAITIVSAVSVMGERAGAGWIAFAILGVFVVIILLATTLGMVLRSQFICLWATLRHPLQGLERLPQNWRETLLVLDLSHPPELIPQAGAVNDFFAVNTQWKVVLTGKTIGNKLIAAIFILFFYPPALAYRWSLKASAWLWFPLILLLKPPFYGLNSVAKNRQIGRTIFGLWRKLPLLSILIFAWLMLSLFPDFDFLRNILPEKMGDFVKGVGEKMHPPPAGGIRYIALWLFCALTFFYWLGINNYEADEKSGEKLPTEAEKIQSQQDLAQLARGIERLRMALIATVIVGGYAFVAVFLHDKNPAYANHFLAPWLLRIL